MCYVELMITYTESKRHIIDTLRYAEMEADREIFEQLNPDLFTTRII